MVGLRHVLADDKLALNGDRDQDLLAIALRALVDLYFDVTVPGVSLAEEAGLTDPPRNAPIGGYVSAAWFPRRPISFQAEARESPRAGLRISSSAVGVDGGRTLASEELAWACRYATIPTLSASGDERSSCMSAARPMASRRLRSKATRGRNHNDDV